MNTDCSPTLELTSHFPQIPILFNYFFFVHIVAHFHLSVFLCLSPPELLWWVGVGRGVVGYTITRFEYRKSPNWISNCWNVFSSSPRSLTLSYFTSYAITKRRKLYESEKNKMRSIKLCPTTNDESQSVSTFSLDIIRLSFYLLLTHRKM